jgi:hypothetical protein
MAEPTAPTPEGPDRGQLPVVTMIGAALSFFLFALLCWLMWYFVSQRYRPYDEVADKTKQRLELQEADRATLTAGPSKGERFYRIPIDKAMQLVIDESKAKGQPK